MDGAVVGFDEGLIEVDGSSDGITDGVALRMLDGAVVGFDEGLIDVDGSSDGITDGVALRMLDGDKDGDRDGMYDGAGLDVSPIIYFPKNIDC